MRNPPIYLLALLAAAAVSVGAPGSARADSGPRYFTLGALAGIYQADELGQGVDGFGVLGSLCLMGSHSSSLHLQMRVSRYDPLDDSVTGWGGEISVAVGLWGGGAARAGKDDDGGYWVFERDADGRPVRVIEKPVRSGAGPGDDAWWELAPLVGLRWLSYAADRGNRVESGAMRAAEAGLAYYLGRDRSLFAVRAAWVREFDRGAQGFAASLVGKQGHLGVDLGFASYDGLGREIVLSVGGWL